MNTVKALKASLVVYTYYIYSTHRSECPDVTIIDSSDSDSEYLDAQRQISKLLLAFNQRFFFLNSGSADELS